VKQGRKGKTEGERVQTARDITPVHERKWGRRRERWTRGESHESDIEVTAKEELFADDPTKQRTGIAPCDSGRLVGALSSRSGGFSPVVAATRPFCFGSRSSCREPDATNRNGKSSGH
jgi:hypothetical protein